MSQTNLGDRNLNLAVYRRGEVIIVIAILVIMMMTMVVVVVVVVVVVTTYASCRCCLWLQTIQPRRLDTVFVLRT